MLVMAWHDPDIDAFGVGMATTGPNGRYRIDDLPVGLYVVGTGDGIEWPFTSPTPIERALLGRIGLK